MAFQAFIDNPQISEPSADMPMDVVAFLERNVFCGPVSDSMVNHSKVRDALLLSIKKEEQAIARHLNQMPHGPHRDRLAGDISALRVEAVELGVGL